jgi:serine/threonine protein kinase
MQVGTKLGAYDIIAKIGEGGMGEVYRARDARLNRDVAIKVIPSSVANNLKRWRGSSGNRTRSQRFPIPIF